MSDPSTHIDTLRAQFERDLAEATGAPALRAVRDRYLARKGGLVSALLKALGTAPADARPLLGKLANELKQQIETSLDERIASSEASRPPAGRRGRDASGPSGGARPPSPPDAAA